MPKGIQAIAVFGNVFNAKEVPRDTRIKQKDPCIPWQKLSQSSSITERQNAPGLEPEAFQWPLPTGKETGNLLRDTSL
jgi:hypothetical protein